MSAAKWQRRCEKQVEVNNHLHERLREVQKERDAWKELVENMQQEMEWIKNEAKAHGLEVLER